MPRLADLFHGPTILDAVLFISMTTTVIWVCVASIWAMVLGGVVAACHLVVTIWPDTLGRDTIQGGCTRDMDRMMEACRWLNAFEVSKFLGIFVGVVCIFVYRLRHEYSNTSHTITAVVLGINMGQAILKELCLCRGTPARAPWCVRGAHALNVLTGVILTLSIPVARINVHDPSMQARLERVARETGQFLFPLSPSWILAYSFWNTTFTYGGGFAASTRLILLSAVLVSHGILQQPATWLECRCVSLMMNMLFRANRVTHLYTPGRSHITPIISPQPPESRGLFVLAWASMAITLLHTFYTSTLKEYFF